MRSQTYSVFYLTIMVIYLIWPVLPYVEYAINKDYIAKNLCVKKDVPNNDCKGHCYLHERLNKSSEPLDAGTDDNQKKNQNKKVEDHLKSEKIIACYSVNETETISYYCENFIDSHVSFVFVPPN